MRSERWDQYRNLAVRFFIGANYFYFFQSLGTMLSFHVEVAHGTWPAWFVSAVIYFGLAASFAFGLGLATHLAAIGILLAHCYVLRMFNWYTSIETSALNIIIMIYVLFQTPFTWLSPLRAHLERSEKWRTPLMLAVYASYTISGMAKAPRPGFYDGRFLSQLCPVSPVALTIGAWSCDYLPAGFFGFMIVFIEAGALPLALFKITRPVIWLLTTILHCGAFFFILDVKPISFGILVAQLFLFNFDWLSALYWRDSLRQIQFISQSPAKGIARAFLWNRGRG